MYRSIRNHASLYSHERLLLCFEMLFSTREFEATIA